MGQHGHRNQTLSKLPWNINNLPGSSLVNRILLQIVNYHWVTNSMYLQWSPNLRRKTKPDLGRHIFLKINGQKTISHCYSSRSRSGADTVLPAGVKKFKKNFQEFWYQGIVYHYFVYNSGGKSKSYLVGVLRNENPDLHFLGALKNRLQICQKYDPSHHDFVA